MDYRLRDISLWSTEMLIKTLSCTLNISTLKLHKAHRGILMVKTTGCGFEFVMFTLEIAPHDLGVINVEGKQIID